MLYISNMSSILWSSRQEMVVNSIFIFLSRWEKNRSMHSCTQTCTLCTCACRCTHTCRESSFNQLNQKADSNKNPRNPQGVLTQSKVYICKNAHACRCNLWLNCKINTNKETATQIYDDNSAPSRKRLLTLLRMSALLLRGVWMPSHDTNRTWREDTLAMACWRDTNMVINYEVYSYEY